MDPFEKALRGDIPLEAAADFFLKLKYGSAGVDGQRLAKMGSKMKESTGGFLPPTAQGQNMPAATAAPPTPLPAPAQGSHKMAAFRKAASEMFGDGMVAPGTVAPKVDMNQWTAMEEQGEAAEQANQAEFLRSKLEQAHAELQAAQDAASMSQQQQQDLMAQQSQHEQQLQAAQQQSQLATQAAMQNVQNAQNLAMKATSQALQAKDDAINTHSLAAQMRMSYQDLRGQIMDAVAQDNAAPVGEAIKAQGALGSGPAAPPGGDPSMGPEGDPNAAGADPNAPASPNASPGGAPGATEEAGAPPAGGADPASPPPGGGATQEEEPAAEPPPGAAPAPEPGKTAGVGSAVLGHLGQRMKAHAPYAAAGAALGGGLSAIESQMDHSGARDRVNQIEQEPGSFGQALRLAAAKAQLTIGEAMEKHPGAGTAFGALAGAGAGMAMGPGIVDGFAKLPDSIRKLQGKG